MIGSMIAVVGVWTIAVVLLVRRLIDATGRADDLAYQLGAERRTRRVAESMMNEYADQVARLERELDEHRHAEPVVAVTGWPDYADRPTDDAYIDSPRPDSPDGPA